MPSKSLHPITMTTLPDKDQKQAECKVLFHQCCSGKGLISLKLVNMLNLSTKKGKSHAIVTAAVTFTTDQILKVENTMLPYLSTHCIFTAELLLIPTHAERDYGVIFDQESMQKLDLDTSIQDSTISWLGMRLS